LVNDEAETFGVLLGVEPVDGAELFVDVVDEELPHAAIPRLAVTASAATTPLLFSKCTINLPLLLTRRSQVREAPGPGIVTLVNLSPD
jgi:hypothetical protein